ncbi:MAG: TlpA disulfide reductase family protein [Myxococcota bacterium]
MVGARRPGGRGADRLPDVEVVGLESGDVMNVAAIEGPAVINLWATWCAPCRAEMPAFQQVHADLGDAVRFIGINEGDDGAAAAEFVADVGAEYDQYLDADEALADALRIAGLPATIVVDGSDTVVELYLGELDEGGLRALLDEQLGI